MPRSPVIFHHNLFLFLSLPFPFFVSRPVSVYMSWLVGELEETRTPFLLSRLEQSQRCPAHGLQQGAPHLRPEYREVLEVL